VLLRSVVYEKSVYENSRSTGHVSCGQQVSEFDADDIHFNW